MVTAFTPINGLKALEQRLELWAKVFEASSEGIVLLDRQGRVLSANRAICKAGAFDPIELKDQELDFVCVGDVPVPQVRELWNTAETRRLVARRSGGAPARRWRLPGVGGADCGARRRRRGWRTTSSAAWTSAIARPPRRRCATSRITTCSTGLPNRGVAEQRLREAMQHSECSGQPVAVLFIDLDRFKTINDSLGHQTGDALLRQVAQRLSLSIRDADTVSRFGGDEFVVLLNGVSGSEEALLIAQRLQSTLRAPYWSTRWSSTCRAASASRCSPATPPTWTS